MKLNGFSVFVPEGRNRRDGYIELDHGQHYTLELTNQFTIHTRCDAVVTIDGKRIGTFRIAPWSSITLERSPDDHGRFTAYRLTSREGRASDLHHVSRDNLGLIEVTFKPERIPERPRSVTIVMNEQDTLSSASDGTAECYRTLGPISGSTYGNMMEAAGTGLSGYSDQSFRTVPPLTYDTDNITTIRVRIAVVEEPRPLRSSSSTPTPPPLS